MKWEFDMKMRPGWLALAGLSLMAVGCSPDIGEGSAPSDSAPTGSDFPMGSASMGTTTGTSDSLPSGTTAAPGDTSAGGAASSAGGNDDGTGVASDDATGADDSTAGADDSTAAQAAEEEMVNRAILEATPVTQLRMLTQLEYTKTVSALFGGVDTTALVLPEDTTVEGFGSVGASVVTMNEVATENYEAASQAVTREVFGDPERWQQLVGCDPQPDLSDACVETFIGSFGRRAFRRELTGEELTQWVEVARGAAVLSEDAATGLATAVSGMLQSPNFLYRIEYAEPDVDLGRLKFDGSSMATRLAYLTTGTGPDDALLDAAANGELDTSEGVRAIATQLLSRPEAGAYMSEFFMELTAMPLVLHVGKDTETFDVLTDELRASMLEETRRWMSEVVVAPGADVRAFFDSTTTFVDTALADFYGISAPQGNGFQEVQLGPELDRAGILGKAGFLLVHSSPDSTNPTRRGKFIMNAFNCYNVPPPPPDLEITIPSESDDGTRKTTRQLFEDQHRVDATCIGCHSVMDPIGFALEHFDAIGAYRETEDGLTIDATGEINGRTFDGAVELSEVLRDQPTTMGCFIENYYRYANGVVDHSEDGEIIDVMTTALADGNYVWRDLLIEFAASDAFASFPPTPVEE